MLDEGLAGLGGMTASIRQVILMCGQLLKLMLPLASSKGAYFGKCGLRSPSMRNFHKAR